MDTFLGDKINSEGDRPIYLQLYTQLQEAILQGKIKHGAKIPSSRALAEQLGISRNTVLSAYRQLASEGYLESSGGSGTYVAHVLPDQLLSAADIQSTQEDRRAQDKLSELHLSPRISDRARLQLYSGLDSEESARRGLETTRPFRTDLPALDAFPYALWSRLVIRRARHMPDQDFRYQASAGYKPLREAIAAHIAITRQVRCTAEQIIITSGAQGGLDLAVRVLINPGDSVWIENPGYRGARGAFLGAEAKIIPIPVDTDGMVVAEGKRRAPDAKLAYLTPSHQFPLGVTLSLSRRFELLEWASQAGATILEDDYDSEYRYAGRPLASLQGLDEAGRVIYIGTFSKVLFPSLRIGYLVLPEELVDPFLRVRRLIGIHSPLLEQAALTDFLVEGHFSRHLRRMRSLYAERRSVLIEAARDLPLEIDSPEAGIHCIGWLPEGMDDMELAKQAEKYSLELTPISGFSVEPLPRKGFLLGYGGFGVQAIQQGVERLERCLMDRSFGDRRAY